MGRQCHIERKLALQRKREQQDKLIREREEEAIKKRMRLKMQRLERAEMKRKQLGLEMGFNTCPPTRRVPQRRSRQQVLKVKNEPVAIKPEPAKVVVKEEPPDDFIDHCAESAMKWDETFPLAPDVYIKPDPSSLAMDRSIKYCDQYVDWKPLDVAPFEEKNVKCELEDKVKVEESESASPTMEYSVAHAEQFKKEEPEDSSPTGRFIPIRKYFAMKKESNVQNTFDAFNEYQRNVTKEEVGHDDIVMDEEHAECKQAEDAVIRRKDMQFRRLLFPETLGVTEVKPNERSDLQSLFMWELPYVPYLETDNSDFDLRDEDIFGAC